MRISDWSSDVCSSDLSSDLRIVIPPTRTVAVPKRSLLRPGPATLPVHCTGDHLQCTLARGRREDIVVGARVLTGAGWPATALQEASQARCAAATVYTACPGKRIRARVWTDRKSTRLNSSH